jgi:hypothetical protein
MIDMKRRIIACVTAAAMALGGSFLAVAGQTVIVQKGEQVIEMSLDSYPQMSGIVAYQGPVLGEGQEGWKDSHAYTGVRINEMLAKVGGMNEGNTCHRYGWDWRSGVGRCPDACFSSG